MSNINVSFFINYFITYRVPFIVFLAGFININMLRAQQNRNTIAWTGILNEFNMKKTSAFIELENSRKLTPSQQDYFTILSNFNYHVKNLKLGIGLSYWLLYDNKEMAIPEWRSHQQAEWNLEKNKFSFLQRTRIENRWIKDTMNGEILGSSSFTLRSRLFIQGAYSILNQRGERNHLQLVISEEFLSNAWFENINFKQNRFYTGAWFQITKSTSLRFGYMWIFSREPETEHSDIIYLTIKNAFGHK
jgi:hypothetical protein